MAVWFPKKLDEHHRKHAIREPQCWKQLLGKSTPVTKQEYSNEATKVWYFPWLVYEAEEPIDGKATDFYRPSAYYVDDREIKVTLTLDRAHFLTCYHKHYSGKKCPPPKPVGEQRDRFFSDLEAKAIGGFIRNVEIIFPPDRAGRIP